MCSMNELFQKRVVYEIDGMENVGIKKDIVYKDTNNQQLLMDVYTPQEIAAGEKLPAVILIHGDAPLHNLKDAGQYISLGQLIAASGLIAVAFNHRVLANGDTIAEVKSDIEDLITYVTQNADSLNIAKGRLATWSVSAGVPFGLNESISNSHDSIRCIVAYYGFSDIKQLVQYLNVNVMDEGIEELSLTLLLAKYSSRIAPVLVARAGLDHPKLNESLDHFISKALANNLTIDIYNHPSGRHAFDLFNDDERTHEIIAKTIDFLRRNLIQQFEQ